jgi:hypothetical protein
MVCHTGGAVAIPWSIPQDATRGAICGLVWRSEGFLMSGLVMIVPSRGRPGKAAGLVEAFIETGATCDLVIAVDNGDPMLPGYLELAAHYGPRYPSLTVATAPDHPMRLSGRLNTEASALAADHFAVGFMGDDHRPRTPRWDQAYLAELEALGTGLVYGDDLFQGERIPTQVALTADIVRALGYMVPPTLMHLWFDNFWKDLGTALDRITYLPDVVIEHMHPAAGKAAMDEGYLYANSSQRYQGDALAYATYLAEQAETDLDKIRKVITDAD